MSVREAYTSGRRSPHIIETSAGTGISISRRQGEGNQNQNQNEVRSKPEASSSSTETQRGPTAVANHLQTVRPNTPVTNSTRITETHAVPGGNGSDGGDHP
ncbi:hypothetical protein ZHAS_00017476 [Anopheles sinensis]|uniref:Uncharacterized protein n=1 Tax=Anopheles sinensis TaxID=74873 RepID=A0A084WGN4_ANOSI|nr:hypothetical protein ZHAS_00017476 [Anopheles sinensis]